jgi:predicted ATP-binding protein involved in virulence
VDDRDDEDYHGDANRKNPELIQWTTVSQSPRERNIQQNFSDINDLYKLVRQIAARQTEGNNFLVRETPVVYYDEFRTFIDVDDQTHTEVGHTPARVFTEGLKHTGIDFRELTSWFAEREMEELRHQKRDPSYIDAQLDAVRRAITGATGFSELEYTVDGQRGLKLKKQGVELHANQLSTGERGFLALAGDLARRLAIVNKGMADPLLGSAIVLIDEIELHLHPRWQRKILPWLLKTFPSCQFVVTTHSPQVLGEVQAKHIRILSLDDSGHTEVSVPRASYGRDSNFLLLSILGADERDEDRKHDLSQIDEAIAAGRFDEARDGIKALREKIEGAAPEVAIAEARLARRQQSPNG